MRFQKRIQILPWVHLNISGSGISFSFGPPGLSVNIGKKGTRVTAGIPGTGISTSHALSRSTMPTKPQSIDEVLAEVDRVTAPIAELLKELDFSVWLENYLDQDVVSISPMYARAVAVTLTHRRLDAQFLADRLKISIGMAETIIALMGQDGIFPSETDPKVPVSKMDIEALRGSFERYERQASK